MSEDYRVTVNYGHLELKPVVYRVVSEESGPWFWRSTRYFIETEFMRLGPFDSQADALERLAMGRVSHRDIVLVEVS